jgi:uncharacterized membrane protein YfhO
LSLFHFAAIFFPFVLSYLFLPVLDTTTVWQGFSDPFSHRSALLVSKQHWPRITDRKSHVG